MFSFAPWMLTALAVGLAAVAAVCFAWGAFLQQHMVMRGVNDPDGAGAALRTGVGVASLRRLAQQPRWLAGGGLVAAGTVLHLSALLLAPISVVQPIGILAVPAAVLLTARASRARPDRSVVVGVAMSVAGTGAFVLLAGGGAGPHLSPVTTTSVLAALLIVAVGVAGLAAVTRARLGLLRCLGFASIGAVSFGSSSALIRLIARAVVTGSDVLSPSVVTAGLAAAGALATGAWAVQQAYASGPAPVVIGALTVGDPLVAVLLSAGLLGEGLSLGPLAVAAVVACAVTAAAGVWLLSVNQPAAVPGRAAEPVRVAAAVH